VKTFYLSLLWDCNENCVFCLKKAPPEQENSVPPLLECLAALKRQRARGFASVSLDGGEPTLRRDLPRILKYALLLGYKKIMVMTNGAALSAENVRRLAAPEGGRPSRISFCVSLHSHKRAVSEKLTRSRGTFRRTVDGIKNLLAAGFDVSVYHVITRQNYRALPGFADFAARELKGVSKVVFSHIYPVQHNLAAMRGVYPRFSSALPFLAGAISRLERAGVTPMLGNSGMMPVCLLRGQESFFTQAYLKHDGDAVTFDRNKWDTRDSRKLELLPFFRDDFNERNRVKAAACGKCALRDVCSGIWRFYEELYGAGELKPYKKDAFSGIPADGPRAVIRAAGSRAAGLQPLLVRLLDARLKGHGSALVPGLHGKSRKTAAAEFARGIGMKLYFGRTQGRGQ